MKIALVFDQFLYGGIERVGISYISILQKAGHTVDVYILNSQTEALVEELPPDCAVRIRPYSLGLCPEAAWRIALQSDRMGLEMPFFALKFLWRKLLQTVTKPRFTVKDREYDIAIAFSGHIRDLTFVAAGCLRASHKLAWCHGAQYQYAMMSPGFFRLYRKIGHLVCLSELCDAECLKFNSRHGVTKAKILNPYAAATRPVDTEKVNALRAEYGDFCLMVGRLARDKDQETVIYAMRYLKQSLQLSKKLLLVGDGPQRPALEKLVSDLGMEEDVIFTGTRADVQNYYLAAFAYVHAALLEGLPTVFLEALSYGLPIVTTDAVPGAREILGDNEFGLISPNKDPEALAKNIKKLYDREELRQSLIQKGTQRIQDFHPDRIESQLNAYLTGILGQ